MAANQKTPDEILLQAIKITEPAEQKNFLDKACKGNESLRAEVESLLKAYAKAGDFLEIPAIDPDMTVLVTPLTERPGTVIGRYKLLEKIGEGGMAVVYMTEQNEPIRRKVALKIIKLGMDTKQVITRFEVERQALALLDHPNIARVFDGGTTDSGRPYFVMEYVDGVPITDFCDQHRFSVEERLRLFVQVCDGVQHAHQKGIIHRDIKPSNVLVHCRYGKPLPKIIDFGIAKAITAPLTERTLLTQQGQLLGTLDYMSPEQAQMTQQDIDTRSDIYSLGVVLYELLTGSLPFDRETVRQAGIPEILRIVREQDPPCPSVRLSHLGEEASLIAKNRNLNSRTLVKMTRGDLDWIVMKSLEKDRTRRYETAHALVEDIERHLRDEPISAGRPSALYRCRKFARRHRAGVTTGSLVGAGLLLALVISIGMALWAVREKRTAQQKAEALRRSLYVNRIHLSGKYFLEDNIIQVHDLLKACPDDLRGWEWYYLWNKSNQARRSLAASEPVKIRSTWGPVYLRPLAISPDANQIACGSGYSLKVWDINSTREPLTLRGHEGAVMSVVYSPDGKMIASGSEDRTIKIWDAEKSGEALSILFGHNGNVGSVAFSPDGRWIASGSDDKTIKVWDINSPRELLTLRGHKNKVCSVAFSPDGKRIASGSEDKTIKIWDAEKGGEPLSSTIADSAPISVAFSPDGRQIASQSQTIKLWEVDSTGGQLTLRWYDDGGSPPAFSPDGRWIAASADSKIKVWDARSGSELITLRGHEDNVPIIAFMPDGKQVVSVGYDNTVKFWDVNSTSEPLTLRGHDAEVWSVSFSPDGKRIASVDMKAVRIWDTHTGSELATLGGHKAIVSPVAFSPDGKRIATGYRGGTIKIWDADTYSEILTLDNGTSRVTSIAFSPDGERLVSGGKRKIWIWNAEKGGEPLRTLDADYSGVGSFPFRDIFSVAFSPDGRQIAYGDCNYTIKIWDAEKGSEPVRTLIGHNGLVLSIAFSPDGRQIASASKDSTIKIWDVNNTSEPLTLRGNCWFYSVAFSPDGGRIVSGGGDGTIRIWDTQSGSELITLRGHQGLVETVVFSPDGKQIAAGGDDKTVKLWHVADP